MLTRDSHVCERGCTVYAGLQSAEVSLPYPSWLSIFPPGYVLFNTPLLYCLSHGVSLLCPFLSTALIILWVSALLEGRAAEKGHAALTCDLADPFLFKPKVQFYRSTKQITQPSRYSIHNWCHLIPDRFWWILQAGDEIPGTNSPFLLGSWLFSLPLISSAAIFFLFLFYQGHSISTKRITVELYTVAPLIIFIH